MLKYLSSCQTVPQSCCTFTSPLAIDEGSTFPLHCHQHFCFTLFFKHKHLSACDIVKFLGFWLFVTILVNNLRICQRQRWQVKSVVGNLVHQVPEASLSSGTPILCTVYTGIHSTWLMCRPWVDYLNLLSCLTCRMRVNNYVFRFL